MGRVETKPIPMLAHHCESQKKKEKERSQEQSVKTPIFIQINGQTWQ